MTEDQAERRPAASTASPAPPDHSAPGPDANRREHARHNIEIEIDVASDHNFYAGITLDLSEGGVFVATHLEKAIGTLVELVLRLPGAASPLSCTGEVRWVRAYRESSDVPPGLGIRFLRLEPGALEVIQSFLAARAPLFYDD